MHETKLVTAMGKGISLEELNRRNRPKKAAQPVLPPAKKFNPVKSEAQIIRELGQQLAQFEREHFRPREQRQAAGPHMSFLPGLFFGTLGVCLFSFFLFLSWEMFQVNRSNFYFWAYLFVAPFMIIIGGASDSNWKILGLIVLIIGWFYWAWLQFLLGHAYV